MSYFADNDTSYVQNLKRAVREAALSTQSSNSELSRDSHTEEATEHFFLPLSTSGFSRLGPEPKGPSVRSKRLFASQTDSSLLDRRVSDGHNESKYDEISEMLNGLDSLRDYDRVNGFLSVAGSNGSASDGHRAFYDIEESNEVFSPPLLMDSSLLADSYEDLLGMLLSPLTCSMSIVNNTSPKRLVITKACVVFLVWQYVGVNKGTFCNKPIEDLLLPLLDLAPNQ